MPVSYQISLMLEGLMSAPSTGQSMVRTMRPTAARLEQKGDGAFRRRVSDVAGAFLLRAGRRLRHGRAARLGAREQPEAQSEAEEPGGGGEQVGRVDVGALLVEELRDD